MEVHPHCHNDVVACIALGLFVRCFQKLVNLRASVANLSETGSVHHRTYQL